MFSKVRRWTVLVLVGLVFLGPIGVQAERMQPPSDKGRDMAIAPVNTAELHQIMRLLQSLPVQVQPNRQRPRVAVIYDGSRSMLSSMSASAPVSKAEVAAEAFGTVMPLLMREADVDVLRYGGEAQGTCWPTHAYSTRQGEIRLPSARDLKSWQAVANSPSSQGSPLWSSVQAAAEIMRSEGFSGGSIVLISDGRDQCPDTPKNVCERMIDLANEGFTVHVLSVNAPRSDRPSLRCMANNTGGVFAHADDPASVGTLLGVLTRVAQAESHTVALEQTLTRLLSQMDGHGAQTETIERQLGQVIRDITAANQHLATIQDDLADHLDQDFSLFQITETIGQLSAKIDALTGELADARQLIRVLEVRLEEANQTIGDRDDVILGMEKEILRLRGVSDRFHKSLGRKTQEIRDVLLQNAELKQRVFDLSREQMSLREKIGILEASLVEQMASSTARANELKNQCDRTIGDLTTHHKEHTKKLKAEREQCQRKQADADTTSDAMIADLKTNIGALQGQVEALGTELAATQEQRDQYRKKYKEERNKHSALLTTLTELQSDREQLKARIAVLEAENATQAAEIQQCQASLDSAIGERGGFTAALENCQSEKDQLRIELDQTRAELSTVSAKLTAANKALDNAQKGNQALQLSLFQAQEDAQAGATKIIALEARIVEQETTIARLEDILQTMKACRHDFGEFHDDRRGYGAGAGRRDEFKQYHEGLPRDDEYGDGYGEEGDLSQQPQPRNHQCGSGALNDERRGDHRGTNRGDHGDRYSALEAPDTVLHLSPDRRNPTPVKRTSGGDVIERLKALNLTSVEIAL